MILQCVEDYWDRTPNAHAYNKGLGSDLQPHVRAE
jgi:hypothetical protein